jgi:Tfp pilus assembly protein PilW
MKQKQHSISGITLIEILIGIVISMIMMGAMFTSYTVVNNSYNQVSDKAKISQSARNLVGMIVRDIRMAGFKYFNDTIKETNDNKNNKK